MGRSVALRRVLAVCAVLVVLLLLFLGAWQVRRLQWKLDLIAKVDARVHAPAIPGPVALTGPAAGTDPWSHVTAANDEYRHVVLTGTYLTEFTTKVQATTELGSGYWLLTPLCVANGRMVMVNRGFISQEAAKKLPGDGFAPAGAVPCATGGHMPVTLHGLLRMSEQGMHYLRNNDPAANRWYAREVRAITVARGLEPALMAPYFVDAKADQPDPADGAAGDPALRPEGGLTVIAFTNNHLVYALTWFALAFMAAGAFIWVARDDKRRAARRA